MLSSNASATNRIKELVETRSCKIKQHIDVRWGKKHTAGDLIEHGMLLCGVKTPCVTVCLVDFSPYGYMACKFTT